MVDYNKFAKAFADSRKDMRWAEIDYFFDKINLDWKKILDVWCWSGRLLEFIKGKFKDFDYTWLDLSEELLKIARESHSEEKFEHMSMLDIDKLDKKFDAVFFIASFHHLDTVEKRSETLQKLKALLHKDSVVFMTNWALNSEKNLDKYASMKIEKSKNSFWWEDFNIKIWEYSRYYHAFTISELDFLFKSNGFTTIENRLFDNQKNYISIVSQNEFTWT